MYHCLKLKAVARVDTMFVAGKVRNDDIATIENNRLVGDELVNISGGD